MKFNGELLIEELPQDCIDACSHSGDCTADVQAWRESLPFEIEDREKVICGLLGYGAWDREELDALSDEELAEKVLWLACCDFSEYQVDPERYGSDVFTLEY